MVPMIIVVRIGLGLAYQGASSTPHRRSDYHDPSSSIPSSGGQNNGQLSTFQAASHQEGDGLQNISFGTSSRTKLDIGIMGSDSRVAGDGTDSDHDGNSGERNGEKEGKAVWDDEDGGNKPCKRHELSYLPFVFFLEDRSWHILERRSSLPSRKQLVQSLSLTSLKPFIKLSCHIFLGYFEINYVVVFPTTSQWLIDLSYKGGLKTNKSCCLRVFPS